MIWLHLCLTFGLLLIIAGAIGFAIGMISPPSNLDSDEQSGPHGLDL